LRSSSQRAIQAEKAATTAATAAADKHQQKFNGVPCSVSETRAVICSKNDDNKDGHAVITTGTLEASLAPFMRHQETLWYASHPC